MITIPIAIPESKAAESTSNTASAHPQIDNNTVLTVILCPPREIPPSNEVLEHEPDNPPRHIVHRIRRRNASRAREQHRKIQIPHPAIRELLRQRPPHHRTQEPKQEEERQCIVQFAPRELPGRADHAPHDRRRPKHLRTGTDKPVLLVWTAHVRYVGEHPRLHAKLDRPRDDRAHDLRPEHRPRRDLHVMPELEVGRERERLRHRDVPPRFEHHHRDRSSGEHVPDDEFRDDIQPDLLIRDGLDHPNRNDIYEGWEA